MSQTSDLAKDRTDWAEDRTILANERTFAAWIRTGLASLALALGMRAVFGAFEPTWLAKSVASLFCILAIYIFWAAQASACQTLSRLNDTQANAQPLNRMRVIAGCFACGGLATIGILWTL